MIRHDGGGGNDLQFGVVHCEAMPSENYSHFCNNHFRLPMMDTTLRSFTEIATF